MNHHANGTCAATLSGADTALVVVERDANCVATTLASCGAGFRFAGTVIGAAEGGDPAALPAPR
jgi:hypothetical protein